MENQQYLLDNVGPMYVEQERQKAEQQAQPLQPDADGNVHTADWYWYVTTLGIEPSMPLEYSRP